MFDGLEIRLHAIVLTLCVAAVWTMMMLNVLLNGHTDEPQFRWADKDETKAVVPVTWSE